MLPTYTCCLKTYIQTASTVLSNPYMEWLLTQASVQYYTPIAPHFNLNIVYHMPSVLIMTPLPIKCTVQLVVDKCLEETGGLM